MFLMISRKVTFVTQKFANPNKSNTFHNYLLTSGSSAYSPAYPSFCYFPPFCFTPLFSGTKKVHTLSYKLDLRSQATHFFMVNIIFLQNKNEQQVNWIYAYLLLVCCNYISCFSKCQTEFYCPLFVM